MTAVAVLDWPSEAPSEPPEVVVCDELAYLARLRGALLGSHEAPAGRSAAKGPGGGVAT